MISRIHIKLYFYLLKDAYETILYNTIQYNTIQYNTIQYNTIQYNTIQYNTIQYNTIQYNTLHYNTIPYHIKPYHIISYTIISYTIIPHYPKPSQYADYIIRKFPSFLTITFFSRFWLYSCSFQPNNACFRYFQCYRIRSRPLTQFCRYDDYFS